MRYGTFYGFIETIVLAMKRMGRRRSPLQTLGWRAVYKDRVHETLPKALEGITHKFEIGSSTSGTST